jgi:anti-anti-sigma factor
MFPEPGELAVSVARDGLVATVTVGGEIDLATSTRLNRELDMVLDLQPPLERLRIDLFAVTFMDTTGVAVLLKARRRALEIGARFTVSSTSPAIGRLLEITGLSALLADD